MKIPLIIILILLTSCASLSKEDCINTSWDHKGELDGLDGESLSIFSDYQQKCHKHGVVISKANYTQGYNRGLRKFCSYNSGYEHGLEGSDPFTECDQINPSFTKGYEEGFREFQILAQKKKIEEEKDSERKKAIERILSSYNSEKCISNSDCRRDGDCTFNKCRHDESTCTFNSDCKIEGDCSNESTYVSSLNEWVGVNVCKY